MARAWTQADGEFLSAGRLLSKYAVRQSWRILPLNGRMILNISSDFSIVQRNPHHGGSLLRHRNG